MMKRCLLVTCLAFSLLLVSASLHLGHTALAADFGRIWHVATTGDDLTGDGSSENPFRTIQKGIDSAGHGDTVLVSPGGYVENIDFLGKAILVASHFILDSLESTVQSTIINCDYSGSVVNFHSGEGYNSVIRGFTIRGGYNEYGGGILCDGSSPTIMDNFVVENRCHDGRGGSGIYCREGSSPKIFRNVVARCTGPAAIGVHNYSGPQIINNTVCYNSWGGISVVGHSLASARNNIVSNNGPYGIHVVHWSSYDVSYNDVFNHAQNYSEQIPDQTGINGNISQDPLFEYPLAGNYHLTLGSPCVDSGDPSDPVPAGGGVRVDMGVFELLIYQGAYPTYLSHQIDDLSGNINGFVNPGELIDMPIKVRNVGLETVYDLSGTLRTDDGMVTILDSVQVFGQIDPIDTAASAGSYQYQVDPLCADSHYVQFELELTDGDSIWLSYFVEVVADTDFALTVVPDSVRIIQGGSANLQVIVSSLGGFASQVSLSHSELPAGLAGTLVPPQLIPTGISIFSIQVASDMPLGEYPVTITASGGGITRDGEIECHVAFPWGDANGDGMIDVADPLYILNYLFKGGDPPDPVEAGDANCDGVLDLGDVVHLLGYLFKGGPPPICY